MTTFFGYFRSSAAYRCRIAFNLKGVTPDSTAFVHLRKGEQRAADFLLQNPHGLVPALEVDGRVLTQSLAIIEWLEDTRPEPPLLPKDPLDRAHVRSLALAVACDIHPVQNLRVLQKLGKDFGQDQTGQAAWARHFIELGLDALERQVATSGRAGRFCFGDEPTLADVCLVPQMFNADRFGIDAGRMPVLARIRANCEGLSAFADAHPSRQPDAEA
jgi:maleylacetoacetate isomerase